jgi:hypothetical protein
MNRVELRPHAARTRKSVSPGRRGKKLIAGHFDPAVSRQLRELAIAEESSIQELLREAINDLFGKKGKRRIA